MPADAQAILEQLSLVAAQRDLRLVEPALAAAVAKVKQYQQRRFVHTYGDLLASERYAGAARFFLDELYGPHDFSGRDAQFARVVPALVRLFPQEIVDTVHALARLHALSERLDTSMGGLLAEHEINAPAYIRAWQGTGQMQAREQQIALTLEIGASLDHLTRKPLLRQSLHLMRGPARAAGLAELQRFLELGFDSFRAMRGAGEFLGIVGDRERALARALFDAPSGTVDVTAATSDTRLASALGQLP
jgi:hypothetical protein